MSLWITIAEPKSFTFIPEGPSLELEDDGYYWFMHPHFETLMAKTGQYVDLYGNAWFYGDNLIAMAETLIEIEHEAKQREEAFDVVTGESVEGRVLQRVDRERLLLLLEEWGKMAAYAQCMEKSVFCFGD
jgi:hypothetical protein